MSVTIANRQHERKINLRLLKTIAPALLAELEIEQAEIGISLLSSPEMTRLNETFLKHKGSTDVITFDYSSNPSRGGQRFVAAPKIRALTKQYPPSIHGEIFVCVDEAVWQARKFGAGWQSEVVRYLIHGVLHLLGFDDSNAAARRKMKREENRCLRELTRRFPLSKL